MLGAIWPTRITSAPSASMTESKLSVNFVSWSIMRCVIEIPQSSIVIAASADYLVFMGTLSHSAREAMLAPREPILPPPPSEYEKLREDISKLSAALQTQAETLTAKQRA